MWGISTISVTHAQSLPWKNYRGLILKGRKTCRLLNHFSPPSSSCFSWVVNSNQFTVWLFQGVKTSTFHLHKQYDSFKHPFKLIPLKVLCSPSRKNKPPTFNLKPVFFFFVKKDLPIIFIAYIPSPTRRKHICTHLHTRKQTHSHTSTQTHTV